MSDTINKVVQVVQRKGDVMQAQPQRHTALRTAAEKLSRCNTDQAICELFGEALMRLVDLCFEEDAGGFCNIDSVTNRILIPLPWGRNGHSHWGIRMQESTILRRLLVTRQRQPGLFLYDSSRRCWRINLYDFSTRDLAMAYLTRYPVGIAEYRAARLKVLDEV
jgi:hypothetical protein